MVGEVTHLLLGMAHAIDIDNLSLNELHKLACRIECRIRSLSASTAEQTATSSPADIRPPPGVAGSGPAQPGMAPGINPETRATLSEKVQDLIHTNDPWEGSGVGPTKWSLPFYGGHIVRALEVAECLPRAQCGPALLPVFGGPPCVDVGGKPCSCENYLGVLTALPARDMPSALRNLLLPVLPGWYLSWTTCV